MTTKHYLLGTAAALAVASIASLAAAMPIEDTVLITPNVVASDHKCTFAEPAEIAALGIDQTVLSPQLASLETGLIKPTGDDIGFAPQHAQQPIFPKTVLAEGDGGAKYPNGWGDQAAFPFGWKDDGTQLA